MELDTQTKEEISKILEHYLKPLDVKVVSFGKPFKMTHGSSVGNEPWKYWEEILYPIHIESKYGKDDLSISSIHLSDIQRAVQTACHNFLYSGSKLGSHCEEILMLLYSGNDKDIL